MFLVKYEKMTNEEREYFNKQRMNKIIGSNENIVIFY